MAYVPQMSFHVIFYGMVVKGTLLLRVARKKAAGDGLVGCQFQPALAHLWAVEVMVPEPGKAHTAFLILHWHDFTGGAGICFLTTIPVCSAV